MESVAIVDINEQEVWLELVERILQQYPVIRIDELEATCYQELEQQIIEQKLDKPLRGKKRAKWENMVDWAKATLTRRNDIFYLGTTHIVYLPSYGNIQGKDIVLRSQAIDILHAFLEQLGIKNVKG